MHLACNDDRIGTILHPSCQRLKYLLSLVDRIPNDGDGLLRVGEHLSYHDRCVPIRDSWSFRPGRHQVARDDSANLKSGSWQCNSSRSQTTADRLQSIVAELGKRTFHNDTSPTRKRGSNTSPTRKRVTAIHLTRLRFGLVFKPIERSPNHTPTNSGMTSNSCPLHGLKSAGQHP